MKVANCEYIWLSEILFFPEIWEIQEFFQVYSSLFHFLTSQGYLRGKNYQIREMLIEFVILYRTVIRR